MDKEVAAVALALVTILGVFLVIQPLIPSNAERFSELGVLGPNQTISGYPTSLKVGQQFLLYGYIGNHEGSVSYYEVLIKLGNQTTLVSNSTSANAPVLSEYFHILSDNQNYTFPINLAVNNSGTNQRLIIELWMYNETMTSFTYTGLWNQLWINVTQ